MTGLSHCVLCIVCWMKFPYGGKNWTLGMHNSMEILENPENVLPGLWIILHPNTMLIPRPSGN